MDNQKEIINLFRKIICSLTCIEKKTINSKTREIATNYINEYIKQYEIYLNKKSLVNYDIMELIDFCNDCYEEVEIFDFAEDVEYGAKELNNKIKKRGI